MAVETIQRQLVHEDELAWIYWHPRHNYVEIEAKPMASVGLYRTTMSKVLDVAREKGAHKMVANAAELDKLSGDDVVWTEVHWAPQAMKAGLTRIAVVIPKAMGSYLAIERMAATFPSTFRQGFEEKFFGDVKSAREWVESE